MTKNHIVVGIYQSPLREEGRGGEGVAICDCTKENQRGPKSQLVNTKQLILVFLMFCNRGEKGEKGVGKGYLPLLKAAKTFSIVVT